MNASKHQRVFFNRAFAESAERQICEGCFEPLVFAMRDKHGVLFSVGLTAMLQCLRFAVEKGDLPRLPGSWCGEVDSRYDTGLHDSDGVWYDDGALKCSGGNSDEIRQVRYGGGSGAVSGLPGDV